MKILTNHPGHGESRAWRNASTFIAVEGNGTYARMKNAVKLHMLKKDYDYVVLGAGRADIFYLLMNTLFFGARRKCLVIDCLWYKSENPLYHLLKKTVFKIADYSVAKYAVWASREIEAYSQAFSLPRKKFVFIPYHHTINNLDIQASDGDYLFSGGNFGRDYPTLIEAVRGLPIKLLIASTRPELFEGIDIPDNVIIEGFSHKGFLEKMAGCKINIVALAPYLLHAGGQQTFLNSMYFGKPTIVLDPEGASDYIVDGVDGLLVEPGSVRQLRAAIQSLLEDPDKARSMGARSREKALSHSTDLHFQKIIDLVKELMVSGKKEVLHSEIEGKENIPG